ncbi:MAG: Lon protease family protein, partial [Armatimonadota bacterium]
GFTLGRSPAGLIVAPASESGEVMNPEEYRDLEEEEREKLEEKRQELQQKLGEIMRKGQREERQTREEVMDLDRGVVRDVTEPVLDELREKYSENEQVLQHLDDIAEDLLDSVPELRQSMEDGEEQARLQMGARMSGTGVLPVTERYRVNLLVDNSDSDGAPVINELNPTIENLTGEVEHQSQMGALVTDFTMIKPGALHRANGGYLILEANTVLLRPFAWDALKRALKKGRARVESIRDQLRIISTVSLEPEPIPLDVKIVLIGSPMLYHLLYQYDEDFRKLFKVKADFDTEIDRQDGSSSEYARFIADLCEEEDLMHFSPEAVVKIVEHGSRLASHQEKLSVNFSAVGDVVREAAYWASQNGHEIVDADDVKAALEKQIYRSNRLEKKIIEMISEGTIMVDVEGETVGQINGLAVVPLGDYIFGKPGRITCQSYLGREGAVSIDREAKLTGRIHDKGVLTLTGYLGQRYAQNQPISLAASLSFEQMYSEMDGDSASSTELYAILSSVAEVPIKQGIAVTGSVNQKGEVQAIGGVNEKIEGFYMTCRAMGLTGEQGVMIPQANVKHLMLRDEVVEAVENGDFHIWSVETIDEGIELLTGMEAGERDEDGNFPEDSVNALVEDRLTRMAQQLKEFGISPQNKGEEQ